MSSSALLTDLYQLTMVQAYLEEDLLDEAVFSLFVRRLPEGRNYLLACGLDDVLRYLEDLHFDSESLDYLESLGLFSKDFLRALESFAFEGDVYAVPEGTPVFANEPILEVVAPLPQAQILETFALNQITAQTVLASKAARVVTAGRGRPIIDFGLRRAQGIDASMKGARAFFIAGVHGTSNVAASKAYGIPVRGTMAHSYIQAHDDEREAFRRFATRYPGTVLLVDTYDTIEGVQKVIDLAGKMGEAFNVRAVRIDSGDLMAHAREARRLLDNASLHAVEIFATGGLDEILIDNLMRRGAPIDAFGVGSDMAVSSDAPNLDTVYKLVEFRGKGRTKLSEGKSVLPGRKQIYRIEEQGGAVKDILALAAEPAPVVNGRPGRPLLVPVMKGGRRVPEAIVTLGESRTYAEGELGSLPARIRELAPANPPYQVETSRALHRAHTDLIASVQKSLK
jgi:nicotinate phosphoribosyltransferase